MESFISRGEVVYGHITSISGLLRLEVWRLYKNAFFQLATVMTTRYVCQYAPLDLIQYRTQFLEFSLLQPVPP